jgi:gliding-associated putative ABC transporter substrate-binding component GldG
MKNRLSLLYSLIFILLVNIFLSVIDFSFDLTESKKHSISTETKQILSELDDIIFVKVYLDGNFPAEFKYLQSEVLNLLTSFKSIVGANFDFEFINPNELVNEKDRVSLFKQLVKNGLSPTDIQIKTSSSNSNQIIFPCALLYYKDKQQAVNFLKNSITKKAGENINFSVENLEYEFISSIHHITKNSIDKIAFLEGNGELNSNQVYDLTESVVQDNNKLGYHYNVERFNIKNFELDSNTMEPDISRQISLMNRFKVIIIAKPTIPFNNLDKFLIDQYIMHGGRVLWLIDGVKARIASIRLKAFNSIGLGVDGKKLGTQAGPRGSVITQAAWKSAGFIGLVTRRIGKIMSPLVNISGGIAKWTGGNLCISVKGRKSGSANRRRWHSSL